MKRIVIKVSDEDAKKSAEEARKRGMLVGSYRAEVFKRGMEKTK